MFKKKESKVKTITELYDEELEAEIQRIKKELTGEEREEALRNFADIYEKRMSAEALSAEKKEQRKARWTNLLKDVGLGVLGIAGSIAMFAAGLKYEEEGNISSTMMKGMANRIYPDKRK